MKLSGAFAVVLDSSPLSLLSHRIGHPEGDACRSWAGNLAATGCHFFVPEIADYETRRELVRAQNMDSVARLDALTRSLITHYLPLTRPAARLAANLWAQARQAGRPTAPDAALDGDVLICAQALLVNPSDFGLTGMIVATENARHLVNYAPAELWTDILP